MSDYEPYLISDFKTAKFIGKDAWLAPADGWPTLLDARIDKGILRKREGSALIAAAWTGDANPIVGIGSCRYSGYHEVVYCTTRRAYFLTRDGNGTNISGGINIFTGTSSDYFWFVEYNGSFYMCNGVDAVYKYTPNWTPAYTISAMNTGTVTIQSCRMLFVYKSRLIFVSPKISGVWYPDRIYYTDILLDNVAATNFVLQPFANETPVTGGYIADTPIIFTREGGIWHIIYTQNSDAPFAWERRAADYPAVARMGIAPIRDNLAFTGQNRLYLYDRYQAQPYDIPMRGVTDLMSATLNANSFSAPMADRESILTAYTVVGGTAHSRILDYNIEERSWSEYSLAVNCICPINGYWADYATYGSPPNNFAYPPLAADTGKWTLAGLANGKIIRLNSGTGDIEGNITSNILSAQFNPYLKEGLKAKLGWVKFLVSGTTTVAPLVVSFYKNHSSTLFKTVNLHSRAATKNWQTIYANGEVGDFFQIGMVHSTQAITGEGTTGSACDMQIHAMMLGFKRAGRSGQSTEYVAGGEPT